MKENMSYGTASSITQAIAEMKAEQGDSFSLKKIILPSWRGEAAFYEESCSDSSITAHIGLGCRQFELIIGCGFPTKIGS